jgi:formamidopyrimidine-DNA glycosylase
VRCPTRCRPISISPGFAAVARAVAGRRVAEVRRRAKRIVLDLAGELSLVIEPRMTGLMLLDDPPDPEHLRLEWRFADQGKYESLWFWDRRGLGTVSLYTASQLEIVLGPRKLGRDALEFTVEDWRGLCQRTDRPIKVAMLDQKLVAGIGNLYASEILHLAEISPRRRTSRLRRAELERLSAATLEVLEQAIRHEGSTLSDGTYRNALNQSGGYQNSHRVYDRAGAPCPRCQTTPIVRIVQAQRATFYCPGCQRGRG